MKGKVFVVILLLCVVSIAHAERTIWYVHPDSALNTIQAGLDSCADNDIVLVGPGTYVENIVWPNTQGIHLISEIGHETTIIDGNGAGPVIACTTDVDTTTIIRSFTIRNGYHDWGAGIFCDGASPIISDNVVTGNVGGSSGWGAAIYIYGAPTIVRNTITTNTGDGIRGGGGFYYDSAIIDTNIIEFNTVTGIYSYGGVFSIRGNTITHNGGWGIIFHMSGPHFTNNTISYNTGSGVGVSGDPGPIDYRNERSSGNNVISHNGGYGFGGLDVRGYKHSIITYNGAGGILAYFGGVIDSCTIAHNYGPGVTFLDAYDTLHVNYCNIFDNDEFGILNLLDEDTIMINAENNWWGDATGPYHPTANPGGLGDSVSDYVDFTPWLTEPVGVKEKEVIEVERRESSATIFSGPLQLPKGKKCRVFDITGRVVAPDKIKPGIYFIEVEGKITQKVVKIR